MGLLGILPPDFVKHMQAMGHSREALSGENIKRINSIIINTSKKAYARYETWAKEKRKGKGKIKR